MLLSSKVRYTISTSSTNREKLSHGSCSDSKKNICASKQNHGAYRRVVLGPLVQQTRRRPTGAFPSCRLPFLIRPIRQCSIAAWLWLRVLNRFPFITDCLVGVNDQTKRVLLDQEIVVLHSNGLLKVLDVNVPSTRASHVDYVFKAFFSQLKAVLDK